MSKSVDENVLSFHETLLRQSDVALLQGPLWLNDHIISFYFEYLDMVVFKNNQNILFMSAEVTQCLKVVSYDEISIFLEPLDAVNKSFIFFPINDNQSDKIGGSHWSLLVFSKPENKFYHFDSMDSNNQRQCENLIIKIKRFLNVSTFTLQQADCLEQTNSYDCGIHVLCNAENIAHYVVKTNRVDGVSQLTKNVVAGKRADILNIIKELQKQQ